MNYVLGLTRVSTPTYVLASALGSTPACVAFVHAGAMVGQAADPGSLMWREPALAVGGFALVVLTSAALILLARRALAARSHERAVTRLTGETRL